MAKSARASSGVSVGTLDDYTKKYVMWATSDWNDLTVSTKTDEQVDAGLTLGDYTITEGAWLGDSTSAIVLPAATPGALCVFRFTGQADGDGNNMTITTAAGDFYAAQTLDTVVTNVGDLHANGPVLGHDFTSTVAVNGGAIKTAAATHNTLTIDPTASNNQTNIGAELAFFCAKEGYWRVSFKGSELGTGALNATFAFSAV